jgi:hypothetical protein
MRGQQRPQRKGGGDSLGCPPGQPAGQHAGERVDNDPCRRIGARDSTHRPGPPVRREGGDAGETGREKTGKRQPDEHVCGQEQREGLRRGHSGAGHDGQRGTDLEQPWHVQGARPAG